MASAVIDMKVTRKKYCSRAEKKAHKPVTGVLWRAHMKLK